MRINGKKITSCELVTKRPSRKVQGVGGWVQGVGDRNKVAGYGMRVNDQKTRARKGSREKNVATSSFLFLRNRFEARVLGASLSADGRLHRGIYYLC
jgi:hypothetical protein